MAIQVSGTEVISNARALTNIASADATTVATLNAAGVGGGFKPVSVSGATQALNVGTYNFFNGGDLSANTTLSFTSVPTDALWTYTAKAEVGVGYTFAGGVAYSGISKSVNAQETQPFGLAFSSDGTKMYIVGQTNDTVYQYTLSTAWDVSTATYASLSKSIAAQDPNPTSIFFSSDGLKMYMVGQTYNTVYQYTLSTAWAINTATYASLSKSVSAQEGAVNGVAFSPDGTKMYIVGQNNDTVYQYTLSTAWNVSTATYASLSKDLGFQDIIPCDLAFSSDGLRMFVVGNYYDQVFQYTLSTAWNVSTATYASLAINVPDTQSMGLAFSSDGTKMFALGYANKYVYQFNNTALPVTITVPAAVQNPPTTAFIIGNQVSYTFVTNDGGTTVKLIGEEKT